MSNPRATQKTQWTVGGRDHRNTTPSSPRPNGGIRSGTRVALFVLREREVWAAPREVLGLRCFSARGQGREHPLRARRRHPDAKDRARALSMLPRAPGRP